MEQEDNSAVNPFVDLRIVNNSNLNIFPIEKPKHHNYKKNYLSSLVKYKLPHQIDLQMPKLIQRPKNSERIRLMKSYMDSLHKKHPKQKETSDNSQGSSRIIEIGNQINLFPYRSQKLIIPIIKLNKKTHNDFNAMNVTEEEHNDCSMKHDNSNDNAKIQKNLSQPSLSHCSSSLQSGKPLLLKKDCSLVDVKQKEKKIKKIGECFKSSINSTKNIDVVFEEETERIVFNKISMRIKKSLTKPNPNAINFTSTQNRDKEISAMITPTSIEFPEFLKKEKDLACKYYTNQREILKNSYEKSKKHNSYFKKPKVLPIDYIRVKNQSNMVLFHDELKKKMHRNVIDSNWTINNIKKNAMNILNESLSDVRIELSGLERKKSYLISS